MTENKNYLINTDYDYSVIIETVDYINYLKTANTIDDVYKS